MKGFIVANRINDIYFMDNDEEFAVHVNKQAKEQGLINEVKKYTTMSNSLANEGNAKRGVSPRLKIWPGDLENQ